MADALIHMPMVNELSFTRFKSSLLESFKGLCEHDTSFVEVWRIVRVQNKTIQLSSLLLETRVSPKRLSKLLTKREASCDSKQSNKLVQQIFY